MASSNHIPEIAREQDTETLLREFLQQSESELEPITPERAVELYLEGSVESGEGVGFKQYLPDTADNLNELETYFPTFSPNIGRVSGDPLREQSKIWLTPGLNTIQSRRPLRIQ